MGEGRPPSAQGGPVTWTRRTVLWTAVALILLMALGFPFTFFFDVHLTPFGFLYSYLWAFPQAAILYAVLYVPLFFAVGLVADLTLFHLRPDRSPVRAAFLFAFLFTAATLPAWALATVAFYPWDGSFAGTWLEYGYFLAPYALATGALGGYVGFGPGRDLGRGRRTHHAEPA